MASLLQDAAFLAFLTSIISGIGSWALAKRQARGEVEKALVEVEKARAEKAPDIQTSLNTMVNSMRDHYERLLALSREDVKEMRHENKLLSIAFDRLERHVLRLEIAMAAAKLEIPPRPEDLPLPPALASA